MRNRHTNQPGQARRGVAAVEAAVTLPLLVVLVLGAMEAANAIFLKQSMTIAAYEAAKSAMQPNGTADRARQQAASILKSRGVTQYEFELTPSDISPKTPSGTLISTTIRVKASSAAMGPLNYFSDRVVRSRVQMVRLGGGEAEESE